MATSSFLSSLGSSTGLSLKDIEVGLGKRGMSFSMNVDVDMSQLTSWFTAIGISPVHLTKDVTLFMAYERSRGSKTTKAFATIVKINIPGPIDPGELFTDFDLPSGAIPVIGNVELSFELDKMTDTAGSTESLEVEIKLTLGGSFGATTYPYVFAGGIQKTGSKASQKTIVGGNIFSTTRESIDLPVLPVKMDIKNVFLAQVTRGTGSKATKFAVFGTDLSVGVDINLSHMPVVGDFLKEAQFSFHGLRITYASAAIASDHLQTLNTYLATIDVAPLTIAQSSVAKKKNSPASFPKGFTLQGNLMVGEKADNIPLHSTFPQPSSNGNGGTNPLTPKSTNAPHNASPVGKKYGPIKIDSASLGLSGGEVEIKFTGGLVLGPLELDFIDFDISSPLNSFDPSISLKGMGISIQKPPLSLEGMFMEAEIDVPVRDPATGVVHMIPVNAYDGSLNIGYKKYSLAAVASYAKLPDGVSTAFIYGFLGAPLGGPPFCFVTGVAAGFGYNRSLTLPSPKTVNTYPLVQPVFPGSTPPDFNAMNVDFYPTDGAFWGAVGIRAESFKMITSFALLVVRIKQEVEIDVIGISKMIFPIPKEGTDKHPLAKIGIGVVARILPERGVLAVNGAFLSGSYVLNPLATITGGFAVLMLFKDQQTGQWSGGQEGDFVITLGGYASNYTPRSYYPKVNRLELQWRLNSAISLKAQAYFAVVPHALMAGGNMQANFSAGGGVVSLSVFFKMGADFIIYWKPYHYSASISISLVASVSIHLLFIHTGFTLDLSADLNVWGPKFSGNGQVHVHVLVSFSVSVSFGSALADPIPVDLAEFTSSFLPESKNIITTHIAAGLNGALSNDTLKVVNPKEVEVTLGTVFPLKSITVAGQAMSIDGVVDFGITPMGILQSDVISEFTITVKKDGTALTSEEVAASFVVSTETRNMPAALWEGVPTAGKLPASKPSGQSLMSGLLSGVSVQAANKEFKPTSGNSFTSTTSGPKVDKIYGTPSTFISGFTYEG